MFKKIFLFFVFIPFLSFAQAVYPDEVLVCEDDTSVFIIGTYPTNLSVDFSDPGKFEHIDSLRDDWHYGPVSIGFDFDFFGTTYTDFVVSTNGYITFNTALANTGSPWSINAPAPSNPTTYNAIHGIYTDVQSSNVTQEVDISWYGVTPNRVCIVTFDNIAMFSCQSECFYSSIILFEGSNEIINSVGKFDPCFGWNNGTAVQGVIDATGSANSVITNDPISGLARNFPNTFSSAGDAVKYTPNAAGNSYTYQFINYQAVGLPTWYDRNGLVIAQGYSFELPLPPFDSLPYQINAVNVICDQIWEDSLTIIDGRPTENITLTHVGCPGETNGEIFYDATGGDNEDWNIVLEDVAGNIIGQYQGDELPISFSNLPSGLYNIISNSPSTCLSETELLIPIEYSQPQEHSNIIDPLCNGESSGIIQFSPHGGFNLGWNINVTDMNGELVGNYTFDEVPFSIENLKAGEYQIIINSPTTCEDTVNYTLTDPDVLEFATENFEHNNCGALTGMIEYPVIGGVPPYTQTLNGDTLIDLIKSPMPSDLYTLKVTDANGCELIREIDIQERHAPIVDFIMPNEVNLADATINFIDLTTPNSYVDLEYWLWEFGDTEVSYERNPTHTYKAIGEYRVYLFVTDENGCQGYLEKTINVISPAFLLPTAFTPNGDGNNEIFKPVIGRITNEDYHMQISDRWGRAIFSTNNIHEGWDGRDKNGNIQSGSYVWVASYKDEFGYHKQENGIVQLIK